MPITLQKNGRSRGYLHARQFASIQGDAMVDGIAMNSAYFRVRTPRETCSTLVHEMCHLWQAHFGKQRKPGYHDKQWAAKMLEIGLMPPLRAHLVASRPDKSHRLHHRWRSVRSGVRRVPSRTGAALGWGDALAPGAGPGAPKAKRIKFVCPSCGISHQLVPTADLKCAPCDVRLEPVRREMDLDDDPAPPIARPHEHQ